MYIGPFPLGTMRGLPGEVDKNKIWNFYFNYILSQVYLEAHAFRPTCFEGCSLLFTLIYANTLKYSYLNFFLGWFVGLTLISAVHVF